jgi:NAD(P)-dependent dehydrogenase (short-subunit alcohol dehydrogenase family)
MDHAERERGRMSFEPQLHSPHTGVVITGGASGIGLATAQALAAVGRPVALWDINAAGAEAAADDIRNRFKVPALGLKVDLRDPQAVAPAASATREALPTIGGLVHSAGTAEVTGIDGVTPENWDSGLNLHVRPIVLMVQAFREELKANPGSAVVALSSINASLGTGMIPIYSAAKAAVLGLVRSMADELANDGIRINAVSPGQIHTPIMQRAIDASPPGFFEKRILLGRLGQAEEIGRLIRFLLSAEASYITAAEFVADGGNISSTR